MMRTFFAALICATVISSAVFAEDVPFQAVETPPAKQNPPSNGGLTLQAAIGRALEHSPRLKSSQAGRASARGERRQARLWQNPEIGIQAENIGIHRNYQGDPLTMTYGVSQLIEIGGKRDARAAIADRSIDIADFDYQSTRLDLIRDVTQAYAEAAAAGEEVRLAESQQDLATDILQSVTKRVDAAREPLIQKSKANVALATSRIALEKAQREYEAAASVLANLMGDNVSVGQVDTASFFEIAAPQTTAEAKDALVRNPDLARWKPAVAKSEAAWELEKANSIPDPRFNVGMRDFKDTDSKAIVVGVSIPIPVLNGNQGNIAKAGAEVARAKVDQRVSELSLSSEFAKSLQAEQAAYAQASTPKETVVPEAKQAFSLSRQGYQAGKFAYLEVLDAERTLTDAQIQYVEALKEYHIQRANVERLTAVHLQAQVAEGEDHDQE